MLLIAFILALMGGLFFGLVYPAGMRLIGIPMDGMDGLLSGLLFGGMSFVMLLIMFHRQRQRFLRAAERLPSRPTHQFQLPMLVNGKYRSVALFFCEDCLCLVDMDRRDLPMTVYPSADIVRTLRINPRQMELHLTQGRVLTFGTGATEALHVALQVRGWLPFQHG